MPKSLMTISGASPDTARSFLSTLDFEAAAPRALETAAMAVQVPLRAPFRALFGLGTAPTSRLEEAQAGTSIAKPASGNGDPIALGIQTGQDQTFLVGSQLMSFNKDVTDDRRAAALNSCLLAQLRASKLYPNPTTPEDAQNWHASYINTLINIGWALQSGTTATETTGTQGASVDKVLLDVVGALLGGGTAVALVTKVLQAIANAKKDDPFITLYESRVVEQNVVEFGAGLASSDSRGFLLSIVECAIEVRSVEHQLLFFKWNADSARADGRRFDMSVSDDVYAAVKSQIEAKILPFVKDYIAALDI